MLQTKLNEVIEYYKNLSAPVRASYWFLVCNILQKGFSMISTPIFTRLLSTQEYGRCSTYYSWYELIYIFATLSISSVAYNNVLNKYEKDTKKATASLLTLSTVVTITLFLIYLSMSKFWNETLKLSTFMICIMFLQFVFEPAFSFWAVKERYNYAYKKLVGVTLFITGSTLILSIISVLCFEHKYEAKVTSGVFIYILVGGFLYIKMIKDAKTTSLHKYWKYAISISVPLIPHYLAMRVLNQSDRIMISRMVGETETAIYSLAYTLSMLMTMITNAINSTLVPYTYKKIKNKQFDSIRKMINTLTVVVLLLCVLIMLIGPELIKLFATNEYMHAIWIIPPVALSVYFMFVYVLFSNVEFYYEKTYFVAIASSITAIANVCLNFVFIKIYGYYAAGYTTLVCYILLTICHYIFFKNISKHQENIEGIYDIRRIMILSVAGCVMMFISLVLYKFTVFRYSLIALLILSAFFNRNKIYNIAKRVKNN